MTKQRYQINRERGICCTIPACDEPLHSNGYCLKHLYRFRRYGDPLFRPPTKSWEEKFYAKVLFTDSCWLWQGAMRGGYGRFTWGGKQYTAHRISFEHITGNTPVYTLDHLCRVTQCVNPAHLEDVPIAVNVMRGEGACVQHARKTHCKNGHEFTPENMYNLKRKMRQCKTCLKPYYTEYARKRREARRAAGG